MRKLILAIDFDGTIAMENEVFPKIGEMLPDAKYFINELYGQGHTIIINTCRTGYYEGMAENWLKEKGIKFNWINCNDPNRIREFKGDCRKISADIYIDNRCLMGLPSWESIYRIVQKKLHT